MIAAALNEDILIEKVDDFLAPFGIDSDFDSDFSYDPTEERVYFTILISERSDRLFKEYITTHFNFENFNIFVMSLLHEVGHFYTLYNFSKEKRKEDKRLKRNIEKQLTKNDSDEVYSSYFDLDIEKAATAWAVDYYKNNFERCEKFFIDFVAVLNNEYHKIGLI